MPKVTDEYKAAKRDEIAEAAMRCIARKGFQGSTMADIITESGLSAGAIYGNFTSKLDIAHYIAHTKVADRVTEFSAAPTDGVPLSPGALALRFLRTIANEPTYNRLMLQVWGEAVHDQQLRETAQEAIARLSEVFEEHTTRWWETNRGYSREEASARAQELTPRFLATCQGFIVQSILVPDFDSARYLSEVATFHEW